MTLEYERFPHNKPLGDNKAKELYTILLFQALLVKKVNEVGKEITMKPRGRY